MAEFIKGLELSERFYEEVVADILKTNFPRLRYSAGLIGWGSEILGFDDTQSTDHNYGLRFYVFLRDEDYEKYFAQINRVLDENLPAEFYGFPTVFEIVANDDQRNKRENFRHQIVIETINKHFLRYLGCNPFEKLRATDWLAFPEHKLLGVTSGKVFSDESGELESVRRKFAYFPNDVWLYLLAAQWTKIFEEQAFVGRCGQVGDELGSALIAARQIKNLMRLGFLIERKYAPYSKWFGSGFSRLNCAGELNPVFEKVLQACAWRERDNFLAKAYRIVIKNYNNLKITSPMNEEVSEYFSRPFLAIKDESVVGKLLSEITDEEIKSIEHSLGSVNQFVDSNALLNDVSLTQKLKSLY
ncbi:MAG TPA: DUF4037 domain-containing protein [Pyrinomonadaceae bacterium]|jgi:hypothetical protein|nr:DUF4037 domain-containing protein [Pyrinomonadaceae bacterium]